MPGTASEHSAARTIIFAHELGLSVLLGSDLHDLDQLLIFEKLFKVSRFDRRLASRACFGVCC